MDPTILVFILVYLGMILGRLPGLAIDRTGVALLGAIVLLASGEITPQAAWDAIDVPTLGLLLGLMVVSAQFRLGGAYTAVTRRIATADLSPAALLAILIAVVALLSALLANDIVCLAVTPLVVEACLGRGLRPAPFLLGVACAANVGSAATLIGNPQNMLIGQTLDLPFAGYLLDGAVPAALGCAATWWVVQHQVRGEWHRSVESRAVEAPPLRGWQTIKGTLVLTGLVFAFLVAPWPREVVALAGAGALLLSRRLHTRDMLALVDWQLLVLFGGLFVVNHALVAGGALARGVEALSAGGVDLRQPAWLFAAVALLSNLVSNVPAVMLLLPTAGANHVRPTGRGREVGAASNQGPKSLATIVRPDGRRPLPHGRGSFP